MDLLEIRKELDILDREIVHLFEKRMRLVEEVAKFKLDTGKAVLDSKREKEKLQAVRSYVEDPNSQESITELFQEMMSMSRRKQIGMLLDRGRGYSADFQKLKSLPFPEKAWHTRERREPIPSLRERHFSQKKVCLPAQIFRMCSWL